MNYTLAITFDAIKKAYLGKPFRRLTYPILFFTKHIARLKDIN